MEKVDYLIIGGGIAGTSAAEHVRSKDPNGSITIITEENERAYSRVLLPHFLRNENAVETLYVRKKDDYETKKINLITNERIEKIDTYEKVATSSKNQTYNYNKLLIASGGKVNKLQFPGNDLPGVVYLRTIEDAKKIKGLISQSKESVVLGGGFIGAEFAQSFVKNNLKTTLVLREKYYWENVIGENSGKLISEILTENGVKVITDTFVEEFVGREKLKEIKLQNGTSLKADIAGIGIGIYLDIDYLKTSDLAIKTGVVTNEFLEASSPGVWAAGDVAEFYDPVLKKYHSLGNWANAAAQGRIAGLNMAGEKNVFETTSMYSINIFNHNFSFLGDTVSDETTETIERGSLEEKKIGRLLIRNNAIVGASLINLPIERTAVNSLIKNRTEISKFKNSLSKIDFNLISLLNS